MDFCLTALTHGDHGDWLRDTLNSFEANVEPAPARTIVHYDTAREGFAGATANIWRQAAECGHEWVFHLEHDFLLTRPVNLEDLARVLDEQPHLAQMALYREPVTLEEQIAGGYIQQRPAEYEPRLRGETRWFETARNWTTNPSLFRTSFAAEYPWPAEPNCEVVFTERLHAKNPRARFGLWGDGTPAVRHIGHRDGIGY